MMQGQRISTGSELRNEKVKFPKKCVLHMERKARKEMGVKIVRIVFIERPL